MDIEFFASLVSYLAGGNTFTIPLVHNLWPNVQWPPHKKQTMSLDWDNSFLWMAQTFTPAGLSQSCYRMTVSLMTVSCMTVSLMSLIDDSLIDDSLIDESLMYDSLIDESH